MKKWRLVIFVFRAVESVSELGSLAVAEDVESPQWRGPDGTVDEL